ncbi:hypothetical protein TWF694_005659 [Orbilia ellipsospora]|uniref:Uncharacterized protein n=1 Tax=Orbilia ellipsospora TaxID=2528407 RepID=A0AAV9WSM5_9PEZI
MKKLFRTSKSPSPASPAAEGTENKSDVKVEAKKKEKKKKVKSPPVVAQPQYFSNIPQLARASDAEALATALAAEVVADNADAGITLLLKTSPTPVDLAKAPENLRRGSVLKQTRLNSVSSDINSSLASPPLSPRSNSVTSITGGRPRVHFDVSEKVILEAQWFSHQQRFTITSGNFLHFERPPTANYRFSTTAESIHTKGTLLQLITSASSEDDKNTWDSTTALPLYAARYFNPNVTSTERTVYWEAEIGTLGFSKFSSHENANSSLPPPPTVPPPPVPLEPPTTSPPGSPKSATIAVSDAGLADPGLSRSLSQTHTISNNSPGAAIAIGFIVKSVTPDTVPFIRRRSSLRHIDEFPFPCSTAGEGVFWTSDNGGCIHIGGHQTRHTLKAGTGDTVGVGLTFKMDPAKAQSNGTTPVPTPPTTPPPIPQKDSKELFRRKSSTTSAKDDVPCADPKDLTSVPVEIFFVINGEKKLTFSSDKSTNPFDPPIPESLLGTNDIFPCICVQGAGVACKTRIGQAVKWHGEGGTAEAAVQENGQAEAKAAPPKETPKKSGRWWSHLGHSGHTH